MWGNEWVVALTPRISEDGGRDRSNGIIRSVGMKIGCFFMYVDWKQR